MLTGHVVPNVALPSPCLRVPAHQFGHRGFWLEAPTWYQAQVGLSTAAEAAGVGTTVLVGLGSPLTPD